MLRKIKRFFKGEEPVRAQYSYGNPQKARDALEARLAWLCHKDEVMPFVDDLLKAHRETLLRKWNDERYMKNAAAEMLGPVGRQVWERWQESGVSRVHHSWGPDAYKLTGEERAQVILDMMDAPSYPFFDE